METELKLSFKGEDSLLQILTTDWILNYCLDTEPVEPVKMVSIYYDTPSLDLKNRGVAVRVRAYDNSDDLEYSYEHTVKMGGKVENGLHQRYEWNHKTASSEFSYDEFISSIGKNDDPSELLEEAFEGIDISSLEPLFKTKFIRRTYHFGYGDSLMEACFDTGKLCASDKSDVICELELELISGDVEDLKDMASVILEKTDAVLFDDSKYKRCLKLLEEE